MNQPQSEFNHAKAFCLMTYRCDETGEVEMLWNSRDGVTPFMIGNPAGTYMMKHINWRSDQRMPDFVPPVDSRIFVDLTREMALESAKRQVERWWDDDKMPMRDHDYLGPKGKDGAAKSLAKAMMEPAGQPTVVVVTPEIQALFNGRGGNG